MQNERTPRPEKVLKNLFEGVKYIVGELDKAKS